MNLELTTHTHETEKKTNISQQKRKEKITRRINRHKPRISQSRRQLKLIKAMRHEGEWNDDVRREDNKKHLAILYPLSKWVEWMKMDRYDEDGREEERGIVNG